MVQHRFESSASAELAEGKAMDVSADGRDELWHHASHLRPEFSQAKSRSTQVRRYFDVPSIRYSLSILRNYTLTTMI